MAGRSSTTFKKRQKELARQDKAREKAAKREERKQHKLVHGPESGEYIPEEDDPFLIELDTDRNDFVPEAEAPGTES